MSKLPSPWLRDGLTVYELTQNDRGEDVNTWSVYVMPGGQHSASHDEREEVARLIQAAPQLYEALKDVPAYINRIGLGGRQTDELLSKTHAALAAASGETEETS